MATLLDPAEPEVRAAADAGREILARLGARPILEQLEAAMGRSALEPKRMPAEEASERSAATAS